MMEENFQEPQVSQELEEQIRVASKGKIFQNVLALRETIDALDTLIETQKKAVQDRFAAQIAAVNSSIEATRDALNADESPENTQLLREHAKQLAETAAQLVSPPLPSVITHAIHSEHDSWIGPFPFRQMMRNELSYFNLDTLLQTVITLPSEEDSIGNHLMGLSISRQANHHLSDETFKNATSANIAKASEQFLDSFDHFKEMAMIPLRDHGASEQVIEEFSNTLDKIRQQTIELRESASDRVAATIYDTALTNIKRTIDGTPLPLPGQDPAIAARFKDLLNDEVGMNATGRSHG